jgi:hypothetical protein
MKADYTSMLVLNGTTSATFAGDVSLTGSGDKIISAISSDDDATLFLSGAGSGKDVHIVYGNDRDLFISKSSSATATSEGTPVLTLTANSTATFAGNVTVQGTFTSTGIDDNADAVAITINGNEEVGIGTTSPFYKLDVNGTFRASGNATFSGTIGTQDRLAIQQTYFGYSSSYKVVQYGETGSTKAISLGYNPSSNTNGGFSGNEILIPNNIRILAPNAADDQFYGVMMFDDNDKLLIGSSNYLIDSNYIMAMDPSTKNVGIGTTGPSYPLQVERTSNGVVSMFKVNDGTNNPRLLFYGDASGSHIQHTWSANATNLIFEVGGSEGSGTERMRIDSANNTNVSIKAVSGTAGNEASLSLWGTNLGSFGSSLIAQSRIDSLTDGTAYGSIMRFYTNNTSNTLTERMRITSAGNVGIGTTSPNQSGFSTDSKVVTVKAPVSGGASVLELIALANADDNLAGAVSFMSQAGNQPLASIQGLRHTSDTSGKLRFDTAGSERMRITETGNVGIGTTSPTSYNSNADDLVIYEANDFSGITLAADNDQGSNIYFADPDDDNVGGITYNHTSNYMMFRTNGAERMRINSSGLIGLGTTSPTGKITVETTGNHIHIRNSGATAGKYWNLDVASNNRFYILDNGGTGVYIEDGATSWTANSDESLKENIKPLENVLDKIKDYRCIEYNLKTNNDKKIGFIAQDWENDFAPIVNKDDDGLLGMKYTETIPVLLKAIQEQQAMIQELKKEIEILKTKI